MKKSCSGTIKRIIQSGRSTFFAVSVSVRFYCHDKSQGFIDRIRLALVGSPIGVLSTIAHGNERFVSGFEDLPLCEV